MRVMFLAAALTAALSGSALAGWQKTAPTSQTQIDELRCNAYARGSGSGFYAFGSPQFVAGAAIGAGIGTLIRRSILKSECMKALGYSRTPQR